jgi:RNA-directed DNA polymerase
VAEGVEGKGLAKGNLPEQNALRMQSWDSVHSALERVRQAAKKDRTMRFTALLHHVYNLDTLRTAYFSRLMSIAAGRSSTLVPSTIAVVTSAGSK